MPQQPVIATTRKAPQELLLRTVLFLLKEGGYRRRPRKACLRRRKAHQCCRPVLSGDQQIALRLGAALLAGGILGLNRELHGKPAGFRTHALVSLGAAVATIAALRSADGSLAMDANAIGRIAQGVLTGIGFLGAGVILRDPAGHVTGLTTAATIWICAVMGMVAGLGHWYLLAITIGLTACALLLGRPLEHLAERLFKRNKGGSPDHTV